MGFAWEQYQRRNESWERQRNGVIGFCAVGTGSLAGAYTLRFFQPRLPAASFLANPKIFLRMRGTGIVCCLTSLLLSPIAYIEYQDMVVARGKALNEYFRGV